MLGADGSITAATTQVLNDTSATDIPSIEVGDVVAKAYRDQGTLKV